MSKRVFSFVIAMILAFLCLSLPANAVYDDNCTCRCCKADVVIHNDEIPENIAEDIYNYYVFGIEPQGADKGITCTLFGHDLVGSYVTIVTHKVRATSPRCLQQTNYYQECSRCEYYTSTVVGSTYIVCC